MFPINFNSRFPSSDAEHKSNIANENNNSQNPQLQRLNRVRRKLKFNNLPVDSDSDSDSRCSTPDVSMSKMHLDDLEIFEIDY